MKPLNISTQTTSKIPTPAPTIENKPAKEDKQAGKDDSPRNIWSNHFKDNWEYIDWSIPSEKPQKTIKSSIKTTYVYH